MRMLEKVGRTLVAGAALTAIVLGSGAVLADPPGEMSCDCSPGYFPVLCPDGHEYFNGCFAYCAHQTGCVPIDPDI